MTLNVFILSGCGQGRRRTGGNLTNFPPLKSMQPGCEGCGGGCTGEYLHDLVWCFMTLVLVVVCSMAIFVFSPEGVFVPVVGPHPGVNQPAKKAKQ